MSNKAKNILIVILFFVIIFLLWMLVDLNYGRYCTPIIKDVKYPMKADTAR
jgi:regulatory protein YycI of two-component signal transduction system YycFG